MVSVLKNMFLPCHGRKIKSSYLFYGRLQIFNCLILSTIHLGVFIRLSHCSVKKTSETHGGSLRMFKQKLLSPHLQTASCTYWLLLTLYNSTLLIQREKKTIQKYQCNCSDAYIFFTNLGDYLVSLSKYRIKGHYAKPFTALSELEQTAYKCPKN